MLSLSLLVVALVIVTATWTENFGDARVSLQDTIINPLSVLKTSKSFLSNCTLGNMLGYLSVFFRPAYY